MPMIPDAPEGCSPGSPMKKSVYAFGSGGGEGSNPPSQDGSHPSPDGVRYFLGRDVGMDDPWPPGHLRRHQMSWPSWLEPSSTFEDRSRGGRRTDHDKETSDSRADERPSAAILTSGDLLRDAVGRIASLHDTHLLDGEDLDPFWILLDEQQEDQRVRLGATDTLRPRPVA